MFATNYYQVLKLSQTITSKLSLQFIYAPFVICYNMYAHLSKRGKKKKGDDI
jgi:hypothetical protein